MRAGNEEGDPREKTRGAIRRHRRPLGVGGGGGRVGASPRPGRCHQRSGTVRGDSNGDGGAAEERAG